MRMILPCVLPVVLGLGCTPRALALGDDGVGAPAPDGATIPPDGGPPPGGPQPPGALPPVYCERVITLDDTGHLALFDPGALSFDDIATLDCASAQHGAGPYAIALDGKGVLWVGYSSGELFTADPQTGDCATLGYMTGQAGIRSFDMSFAPDPATGQESLFVSSVADVGKVQLAAIDPATLVLRPIAPMTANAELTTRSDELWGLFRGTNPHAARIDRSTAALGPDLHVALGDITGDGLAFASLSDAFYVFLLPHNSSTAVFKMSPADGSLDKITSKTGRRVISATVAACR